MIVDIVGGGDGDDCDDNFDINQIIKIFNFVFDKSFKDFIVKYDFNLNLKYFNLNFLSQSKCWS